VRAALWTAYGPPEVLQLGERPMPEPRRGQVRIRVHATSVTYSDTFVRGLAVKPLFRLVARMILGLRRPKRWPVLGIVVAGEIDRVGRGVTSFREGDQVFAIRRIGLQEKAASRPRLAIECSLAGRLKPEVDITASHRTPQKGI